MRIIYGLKQIKKFKKSVVALGVFDGVHRGHRYILKETVKKAKQINGRSIVVTFYPHPQGQKSLYSLKHRLRLIAELGVDICIVIKFNRAFSKITAVEFIKDILMGKIGANFVYVGKNFRFGKSAKGNYRLLDKFTRLCNYRLRVFDVLKINNKAISSTYIRKLITNGSLDRAKKLLLSPVTVLGTVVKGISLARNLGFPTANIDPHHEILPPAGVYLVKVIFGSKVFNGVCNIGKSPKIKKYLRDKLIEVYILNFNRNIYGRDLEIRFLRKIRDEKKFHSLSRLTAQIKKDVALAQKIFPSLI